MREREREAQQSPDKNEEKSMAKKNTRKKHHPDII